MEKGFTSVFISREGLGLVKLSWSLSPTLRPSGSSQAGAGRHLPAKTWAWHGCLGTAAPGGFSQEPGGGRHEQLRAKQEKEEQERLQAWFEAYVNPL